MKVFTPKIASQRLDSSKTKSVSVVLLAWNKKIMQNNPAGYDWFITEENLT